MDSGALLNLLGNENRRRILRLLSHKPCYVTEISDYIGVSPKAVIDHLQRLEEAGLVESHVDEGRRKYFRIARNLRLEVTVSPYGFGMKSAYPASANLDLEGCHYLSLNIENGDPGDVSGLASELDCLRDVERELSLAQRWVQGRIAEIQRELGERVGDDERGHVGAEVLAAVAGGADTAAEVATEVDVPEYVAENVLEELVDRDLVAESDDGWELA